MAIFVNYSRKVFIFTSYKVAYSTLESQIGDEMSYLNHKLSYPVFKHIIKHFLFKKILLVRNPYDRFLSLFSDKFRKQPKRILNGEHDWENVHKCMYSHLGLSEKDSNEKIAEVFLKMTLEELIVLLPEVMHKDEHFMSQKSTIQFKVLGKFPIGIGKTDVFRLEEQQEAFSKLTGINFDVKSNTSNSNRFRQKLSNRDLESLNKIYKKDFKLGNYKMIT